jgi:hypothetical protein
VTAVGVIEQQSVARDERVNARVSVWRPRRPTSTQQNALEYGLGSGSGDQGRETAPREPQRDMI